MSAHGLTPEALKQQHRTEIVEIGTFRPHGVTELEALDYLETQEGKKYLQNRRNAAPDAPKEIIAARAMEQITSGREIPRMEAIKEPQVKIIPAGVQDKSLAYSPPLTRQPEFEDNVSTAP